jgi:hypothetical protein
MEATSQAHGLKRFSGRCVALIFALSAAAPAFAKSNQGGHYAKGHGSSHKGGHYKNARTHDHYTKHEQH